MHGCQQKQTKVLGNISLVHRMHGWAIPQGITEWCIKYGTVKITK